MFFIFNFVFFQSDEDQSTDAKNAKKNTKLNEEIEDNQPLYARRRLNKTEEVII